MSLTAADLKDKLHQLLTVVSLLDPKVALAAAGVSALADLFSKTSDLNTLMDQVFAETAATAPEVAQAVSAFYKTKGDALEASFHAHPGK